LQGAPRAAAADLIRWANRQRAPVLALDAPSGVDTTTGTVHDPAIQATATMTLALPKEGLRAAGVREHVGELYLADISVPPALYAGPGLGVDVGPIFAQSEIVRLV
jgi:NAD(P)H-hydrate epimerase